MCLGKGEMIAMCMHSHDKFFKFMSCHVEMIVRVNEEKPSLVWKCLLWLWKGSKNGGMTIIGGPYALG